MKTYINYTDTEAEKRSLDTHKRKAVPKRDFNEIMLKRPRKNVINNLISEENGDVTKHISDEENDVLSNCSSISDKNDNAYANIIDIERSNNTQLKMKNNSPVDVVENIENVNVNYSSFVDDLEQSQNDPLLQVERDLASGCSSPLCTNSDDSFDSKKQSQTNEEEYLTQDQNCQNVFPEQINSSFHENLQVALDLAIEKICSRIEKQLDNKFTRLNENFTDIIQQMKILDKKLEDEPVQIKKDTEFKAPVPITSPEKLSLFNSKLGKTAFREQMVCYA